MKKFFLLLLMLAMVSQADAQMRAVRLGQAAFKQYDFEGTIEYLERVKKPSSETIRMLGQSHAFLGNLNEASSYYSTLADSKDVIASDFFEYSQVLMALEKYEEAIVQLNKFHEIAPDDSRAIRYKQAGDFVGEITSQESDIEVKHLKINGLHQDFPSAIYRDELVFASSRIDGTEKRDTWTANRLPYLRPFIATKTADGELSSIRQFLPTLLSGDFHVGPVAISAQEDMMAVTVNYPKKKGQKGSVNLQLLTTQFVDASWSELKPVPFNNPEYSVGHAAFSPDGKTLYFVSDMPGGKGGTDIYKVDIIENGRWSQPQNMSMLNTEGNEMFPFVYDNYFFFSSDGHVGLGGLDVFYMQFENGTPGEVVNMGSPINSSRDDFALVIDKNLKTGYFSSRRKEGIGNDDIYYFSLKMAIPDEPIKVEPVAAIPAPSPEPKPEPTYKPGMLIEINPIYFDFDRSNIREDAALELEKVIKVMNDNPDMVVELGAHTDCRGTEGYNLMLSRARMNNSMSFIKEKITKPERLSGFFYGKSQLLNRCDCSEDPPCSEDEHQLNRRTEFRIISM